MKNKEYLTFMVEPAKKVLKGYPTLEHRCTAPNSLYRSEESG